LKEGGSSGKSSGKGRPKGKGYVEASLVGEGVLRESGKGKI